MKTQKNNESDRENVQVLPIFTTVDGIGYILCYYCGRPMTTSNVYIWKEDKDGKPYNESLRLVHYECQEPFEQTHKGEWFGKGMPSPRMGWDEDDQDIVEVKDLSYRPPGNLKRVFVVWNKYMAIVGICKSISIALKIKPVDGSVDAITLDWLVRNRIHEPAVRNFLKTHYGIWVEPKRKRKE